MKKEFSSYHFASILVLILLVSRINNASASSNTTHNTTGQIESCLQSPIKQNVTLRGGINAGLFKKLAQFVAMQLCIRLCCEEKGCDVALMSGKNCYGVQCFSEELCTAVPARKAPSSLMISHVTITGEAENVRRSHPVPQNLKCTETEAEEGVTLKGGMEAGNFTDVGTVESIDSCTRLCCVSERCDLAMLIKGRCFLVKCFSKELCKTVKTETKNYRPTIAFVQRWVTNVTEHSAITLSNLPTANSKLMCKNSDIHYNSTLREGIKAGNFTDLGKISEMSTCIRMCCGRKDCDVALMLEANCYAVNCYNEESCQAVLARKSGLLTNLSPRLSYITARDEEVLPQKISIGNGISCRPSVISYDVTLRGGLSAGQYAPIGHVDGMEACVNLCCKRNTCDIALMLRDSCYSITCASEELCEEVPAPSSNFYPRLSYVRRDFEGHTKKEYQQTKPESPGHNIDNEDDLDTKEEGYCTNSEVMANVTLRGGITTGRFRDRGKVPNMRACVEICCISKTCDVAFMLKNNCFSVTCLNERLCEAVKARSSIYSPRLVYIYARTKSEVTVTPVNTPRRKRLKRRAIPDEFIKRSATNIKRSEGKDRFKCRMHRKVKRRSKYKQLAKK